MIRTRFILRLLRLKARNVEDIQAIDKILKDRELLNIIRDYFDSEVYGSPLDILDWILANWEEILKVILTIINLKV